MPGLFLESIPHPAMSSTNRHRPVVEQWSAIAVRSLFSASRSIPATPDADARPGVFLQADSPGAPAPGGVLFGKKHLERRGGWRICPESRALGSSNEFPSPPMSFSIAAVPADREFLVMESTLQARSRFAASWQARARPACRSFMIPNQRRPCLLDHETMGSLTT